MKGFYGYIIRNERLAFQCALVLLCVIFGGRMVFGDDKLAADTQFNANLELTNGGEYEIAQNGWENFLLKYPDNSQRSYAEHYLAICKFQTKQYEEAEKLFQKVLSDGKYPNQDETMFFLGVTFMQHAAAFPAQPAGVRRGTVETTADRRYTLSREAEELYAKALTQFQTLWETFPDSTRRTDARFYEALAFMQLGKYENARGDLKSVVSIQHYPDMNIALFRLSECDMNLPHPGEREAMMTLLTLLARNPETSLRLRAVRLLGDIHFRLGDYAAAKEKFQSIFEEKDFEPFLNPETETPSVLELAFFYYRYGETLVKLENFADAAAMFARIPAEFPENGIGMYARYQQVLAMKKFNEQQEHSAVITVSTEKTAENAESVEGTNAANGVESAENAVSAGNVENAVKAYPDSDCIALLQEVLKDKNIKKDSSLRSSAAHLLTLYYLKNRDSEKALETVESVTKNKKLTRTLLRDRADALTACGRTDEAIADYRKLFETHQSPKNRTHAADAMYQVARIYEEREDYENVLDVTNKIILWDGFERIPDTMQMIFLEKNAAALFQLKDYKTAQEVWERLVKRFPKSAFQDSWLVFIANCCHKSGAYRDGYRFILKNISTLTDELKSVEMRHLFGVCCRDYAQTFKSEKLEAKYLARAKKHLIRAKNAARNLEYSQRDMLYLDLSMVYFYQKDYENCVKNIGYGLKKCPDSPLKADMYFLRGRCEVEMKELEKAALTYEELMEKFPKSEHASEAGLLASQSFLKLNKTEKAIEISRKMEKLFPNSRIHEQGANVRAIASMEAKEYDAAIEAWNVILNSDSEEFQALHSEAMYGIGHCLFQKKDFHAAETQFRALLEKFPDCGAAERTFNQLTVSLLEQKKTEDAQNVLAEMHGKFPKSVHLRMLYSQLGDSWFAAGNMNEAENAFWQVLELNPKKRDFLLRTAELKIAWSLYHRERFQETLEFIGTLRMEPKLSKTITKERAEKICANRAELQFLQGLAFYRVGETKKTLEIMQKVRKIPELASVLSENALGIIVQIYEDTQKWENVLETAAEFQNIYPQSETLPRIQYSAAFALFRLNRMEEARAKCEVVQKSSDTIFAIKAFFLQGETLFAEKKYEQAIPFYYQVIYGVEAPQLQADAMYEAAQCFELLGKIDKSIKLYHDLLEKYPESDKVNASRKKMKKLQAE